MTATGTPLRVDNPYVGPTSFRLGDTLHGRDREREDLVDLLVAERIVLLYSPSGAGKTSLIQAAVVPALRDDGFEVLPVVRVTHALEPRLGVPEPRNRYVMSVLLSLEEGVAPEKQRPVAELATLTLHEYLEAHADRDGRPGNEVLVFDQFEEVLTADPTDEPAKHEFFRELGQTLRNRGHWALFSMREDFLAALDPYLGHVPTRLRARFRLDLLSVDEALEAMRRPAQDAGTDFTEEAAQQLVDDLRTVRVQQPPGRVAEVLGSYVEPVQLQVACHLLWSVLPPDATEITRADVEALGRVDQALAGYYAERVRTAAERTGVPERGIREWFEERLITPQGLRSQVLLGPESSAEAGHRVLAELLDAHLVRAETRRQATWYELAHDRLIEPVRRDNAAWRAHHLSSFERAAVLWDQESRPERLLLLGADLAAAEQEEAVRTGALTQRQREFLDASRRADEQVRREQRTAAVLRRSARRLRIAVAVTTLLAVAAAFFLVQSREAESRTQRQESLYRLLSGAQRNLFWDQQLAVALAADATEELDPDGLDEQIRDVLYLVASAAPESLPLRGRGAATTAAISADGSAVVTAGAQGLQRWDRATGTPGERLSLGEDEFVAGIAVSRDARTVLAEMTGGTLLAWDVDSDSVARWTPDAGVWAVALSPDGTRAASTGYDQRTQVWHLGDAEALEARREREVVDPAATTVWDLAFSADSRTLVTLTNAPAAVLWDVPSGRETGRVPVPADSDSHVALSPDGATLATIESEAVTLWDVASGRALADPLEDPDATHRTITPDFSRVVSVNSWGEVSVVDPATGTHVALAYVPGTGVTSAVPDPADPGRVLVVQQGADPVFWRTRPAVGAPTGNATLTVPAGERVFTLWDDGTVRVWDAHGHAGIVPGLRSQDITAMAGEPSGRWLAGVTSDGAAHVWDVRTGAEVVTVAPPADYFTDVALTPDGAHLVTGDSGGRVLRWDARTGEELDELLGAQEVGVSQVFVSPDGSRVLAQMYPPYTADDRAAPDQVALVLSLRGPAEPVEIRLDVEGDERGGGASEQVTRAGVGLQGERVFLGTTSGRVVAFDSATGEQLWRAEPHRREVREVVVGPGGEVLSTGSDRQVVVLDPDDGRTLRRIPSEFDLQSAVFTADGERIAPFAVRGALYPVPMADEDLVDHVRSRVLRELTSEDCELYRSDGRC